MHGFDLQGRPLATHLLHAEQSTVQLSEMSMHLPVVISYPPDPTLTCAEAYEHKLHYLTCPTTSRRKFHEDIKIEWYSRKSLLHVNMKQWPPVLYGNRDRHSDGRYGWCRSKRLKNFTSSRCPKSRAT